MGAGTGGSVEEDGDREGLYGALGARLRQPVRSLDLASFAGSLHARKLIIRLPVLAVHALDPGLAGRIGGGFGEEMMAGASPEALMRAPCP